MRPLLILTLICAFTLGCDEGQQMAMNVVSEPVASDIVASETIPTETAISEPVATEPEYTELTYENCTGFRAGWCIACAPTTTTIPAGLSGTRILSATLFGGI